MLTRRGLLATFITALATPSPVLASGGEGWADHVRARLLGFDVGKVTEELLISLEAPRRLREGLAERLPPGELIHGFRSVAELMEDSRRLRGLGRFATHELKRLSTKLWIRRLLKHAPEGIEEQQALIQRLYTEVFGLNMEGLRAHVATLPPGGLLAYGPPTNLHELGGLILREPFALFVQAALGRRCEPWLCLGHEAKRGLLERLLDPQIVDLAFVGHGTWSSLSLSGYRIHPEDTLNELCRRAREDTRAFAGELAKGHLYGLVHQPRHRFELEEEELQEVVRQLGVSEPSKERLLRFTCGTGRYRSSHPLVWALLPEELSERTHASAGSLGRLHPGDTTWLADLRAWMNDRPIELLEAPQIGGCLAQEVYGWEGVTWLPDFLEAPLAAPEA